MNTVKIRTLFLLSFSSLLHANSYKTSQTFMFTRPVYQNAYVNWHTWKKIVADVCSEGKYAAQVSFIHQHSIHNHRVDQFFLLNCKNIISVAGDNVDPTLRINRDIRAEWLGLPAHYTGAFTVRPCQQQTAVIATLKKNLYDWLPWSFFETFWVSATIPFVHIRNNLNFQVLSENSTEPLLKETFSQPSWRFGKMDNHSRTKNQLAELRLMMGNIFINEDDFLLATYTGFGIPLTKKHKPHFIFAPYSGSNGHFDFTQGFLIELPLHETCAYTKCIFFGTIENHFYLKNHQKRVLDIKHPNGSRNEYSRYLLLQRPEDPTLVPAVNILTQKVVVKPFDMVDLATGLRFEFGNFNIEAGYHLWAHQREQLKILLECCEGAIPLVNQFGIAGSEPNTTASQSSIAQQIDDPPGDFVFLQQSHLDLTSGASRGGFVQGGYLALGYLYNGPERSFFASLGVLYENPHTNIALEQWGVWFKVGGEF